MKTKIAMLLAALCCAGLAQAQSHSVANYSNPPGNQSDSKAGTDATPGHTATADQQDSKHANKGAKDHAANQGKKGKTASQAKASANAAGGKSAPTGSSGSSKSSGMTGSGPSADAIASKAKSQSATASVALDGASKGGAEATMQAEPSARNADTATKEAFDVSPGHDGTSGSNGSNGNAPPKK